MVISRQITKTAGQLPTDVSLSQPSCIHRHHQQQPQALGEWLEFSGQPRVPLSRYVMPQGDMIQALIWIRNLLAQTHRSRAIREHTHTHTHTHRARERKERVLTTNAINLFQRVYKHVKELLDN